MYKNIIFIGGIHGVGKGTFCKDLLKQYAIEHLTCSSVLKWQSEDSECTKTVNDISGNQNRLILNLNKILQPNKKYLLDGHFCLLKSDFSIETIPFDIYSGISPVAIAVLSEDIDLICKRLKERDNKQYDSKLLFTMQKIEKEHGGWVANKLDIPFFAIQNVVDNELKEYLHEFTCVN